MPANLTQQYHKAEQAYRQAATPEEELECLQRMLRELPKHKGTDKLNKDLKTKISKLKKDLAASPSSNKRAGARIPRQGAGRVVLLGAPNCGKSQFVDSTTRAEPEVADYPFTTRQCAPAMMQFEDVAIQLIDTPPVTPDVLPPDIIGLVRGADLVMLFLDASEDEGLVQCRCVLDRFQSTKTRLARDTYVDEDDLGVTYTQTFLIVNKTDVEDAELRLQLFQEEGLPDFEYHFVDSRTTASLDTLGQRIFEALDVVRIYTKMPKAKEPDMDRPFTIRRGGTLADIAAQIHKDVAAGLKSARVWGTAVHDGTVVKPDYVLHDKDIVELHI